MADGAVDVDAVLKDAKERYKTVEVRKDIDLQLDVGNLLASDAQPIELKEFRKSKEDFLRSLARDNTQLLFNEIWKLPTERYEGVVVAKLPAPTTIIPREKPVPKPKPPTKWEEFAKAKGIQKKKRERMIWDETRQEWRPRWGFKRAQDDTKDWLIEIPHNADPYKDYFEERSEKKKERVAKNEFQRLRNIAKHKNVKVSNSELAPAAKQTKDQVTKHLNIARTSTASLGKFQEKLPKEKIPKSTGKKRKFETVAGDMKGEKSRALELAEKVIRKDPLDVTKQKSSRELQCAFFSNPIATAFFCFHRRNSYEAVNKHIAATERSSSQRDEKSGKKGKGRRSKQGGRNRGGGKNKGGRQMSSKTPGKKRR